MKKCCRRTRCLRSRTYIEQNEVVVVNWEKIRSKNRSTDEEFIAAAKTTLIEGKMTKNSPNMPALQSRTHCKLRKPAAQSKAFQRVCLSQQSRKKKE